jgi:hypothetical protein
MKSSIIHPRDLANGHALSFESQPYLGSLFEEVARKPGPVVIIVGAGVSMNSGLPSWSSLLDNLSEQIGDPILADLANQLEGQNLQRRAETLVQLTKTRNSNRSTHEILINSLYRDGLKPDPGPLAEAVARLAVELGNGSSIVTTNYDDLLEQSLLTYLPDGDKVNSYALNDLSAWEKQDGGARLRSVLHLHGMVRQGTEPRSPLVLTESHFLKYGTRVREVVARLINESTVLFVGLSMTDPNLLGPLFESGTPADHGRYALFVPRLNVHGVDRMDCAAYAVENAKYLEAKLSLRPVLLKSHSQTTQVVSDLALARRHPAQYKRRVVPAASSLYYGQRFRSAMQTIAQSIGEPSNTQARERLSQRLRDLSKARNGVFSYVRRKATKYKGEVSSDEGLAVFLWLREHSREPNSPYALRLRASSAYVHWDEWSGKRLEDITELSNYTAVQAVYLGRPVTRNLSADANGQTWRGSVAIPLVFEEFRASSELRGQALDRLFVGALTLNSTCAVDSEDEVEPSFLSAISAMDEDELQRLNDLLLQLVFDALSPSAEN